MVISTDTTLHINIITKTLLKTITFLKIIQNNNFIIYLFFIVTFIALKHSEYIVKFPLYYYLPHT